jgi:lambda family phage tail tape measure protein
LNKIANAAQVTTELLEKDPLEVQIGKKKQEIADLQAGLAQLEKDQPNFDRDITPLLDNQKRKIAELKAELQGLNDEVKKQNDDKAAAVQGAADAQRQVRADALEKLVGDLDKAMDKTLTAPDEKIAKINEELATTKQRIEALREKDNGNAPAIDAALKEAETVAQRQIDAVMKPVNEAAQKAEEQNQKVLSDLQRQLLGFSDQRQSFIDQAVSRLSDSAGKAEIEQTKKLAGALFDQKAFTDAQKVIDELSRSLEKVSDKRQAAIDDAVARLPKGVDADQIAKTKELAGALYDQGEAEKQRQKLLEEGKRITDETKTAAEGYAQKIDELNKLLAAGAITQNVYNEAIKKVNHDSLAASTDALDGTIRAFQDYGNTGQSAAQTVEKAFTSAMDSTTDAIAGLVTSGSSGLQKLETLANSVVNDITKMIVKQSITGPLFNAIGGALGGSGGGGFFGDLFGSIFHDGGVAGGSAPKRRVPAYIFAGAPRYHTGGIAGLQPGEIPAILQRGETVLPKNTSIGTPVNVIMNIQTPDASGFRASQAQIAAQAARNIKQANRNL